MIDRSGGWCGTPVLMAVCAGTLLSVASGALAQDFPNQAALAQTPSSPSTVAPEERTAAESEPTSEESQFEKDEKFHVTFTPYMWLPSMSGTLGVKGTDIDVDASFLDIFDDSNLVFGLMGAVELQYDRFLVQFNGAWTYVESDSKNKVPEDATLKTDTTTQTSWLELLGGYRILDRGMAEINDTRRFTFDAFAGGRLTILDADLDATVKGTFTLPDGTPVEEGKVSDTFDDNKIWGEPFIGLRTGVDITDRIGVSLRGDIGGFGIAGSKFSWQFIGGVGYTFHMGSWDGAALLGFRALSQDYEDGGFKWDVVTYGPIMGVQFAF